MLLFYFKNKVFKMYLFYLENKRLFFFFFKFLPLVDKRELLEIAKANAAKALGTDNIVLPASLKLSAPAKETKTEKQERGEGPESAEVSMECSPEKVNTS